MDAEKLLHEIELLSAQLDQCYEKPGAPGFTGLIFHMLEFSLRMMVARYGPEQSIAMLRTLRDYDRGTLERLTGPQPPL